MRIVFLKTLLRFAVFMRAFTSPFVWRIFYKRKRYTKDMEAVEAWQDFMVSPMVQASNMINSKPYKSDIWRGFIDASTPPKYAYTFFSDLMEGRDCDDWARLWSLWGKAHGYVVQEWVVTSTKKGQFFSRAHMVTTLSKYGEHWLMDYRPFGPHNVLSVALSELSNRYGDDYMLVEYKWKREW